MKYLIQRDLNGSTEIGAVNGPIAALIHADSEEEAILKFNRVYGTPLPVQIISCPSCKSHQDGRPEDTGLFLSYVHNCTNCGYTILESEWELAA